MWVLSQPCDLPSHHKDCSQQRLALPLASTVYGLGLDDFVCSFECFLSLKYCEMRFYYG